MGYCLKRNRLTRTRKEPLSAALTRSKSELMHRRKWSDGFLNVGHGKPDDAKNYRIWQIKNPDKLDKHSSKLNPSIHSNQEYYVGIHSSHTLHASEAAPKYTVLPPDRRKSMSKSSNTSLLGWWIEAMTVRPSMARFRIVCVTKKAEALQKPPKFIWRDDQYTYRI